MKKSLLLLSAVLLVSSCSGGGTSSSSSSSSKTETSVPSSSESSSSIVESSSIFSSEEPEKKGYGLNDLKAFRSDVLTHKIDNGVSVATISASGEYDEEGVYFDLLFQDNNIQQVQDAGYCDNIEIQVQAMTGSHQLNKKAFDFLVAANGSYWIKQYNGSYNVIAPYSFDFSAVFSKTSTSFSCRVFFSYSLLGVTPEEGCGNVRLFLAGRNRHDKDTSVYQEYGYLGSEYWQPSSWFVLGQDNVFFRDDLKEIRLTDHYSDIGNVVSHLASVSVSTGEIKRVGKGASAFLPKNGWGFSNFLPEELYGDKVGYVAQSTSDVQFAVTKSGYVIIAVDAINETLRTTLTDSGFSLLAGNLPDMLTFMAHNSNVFNTATDYYYKNMTAGDSFAATGSFAVPFVSNDNAEPDEPFLTESTAYCDRESYFDSYYNDNKQIFTCGPVLGKSKDGRLFAAWSTGGTHEPLIENHNKFVYSDDNGQTWQKAFVLDSWLNKTPGTSKTEVVIDVNMHLLDDGSIALTYSRYDAVNNVQSPNTSVGLIFFKNPDADPSAWEWSESFSFGNGWNGTGFYQLKDGRFLLYTQSNTDERVTNVYSSSDKGKTWDLISFVYAPAAYTYDECIFTEKKDGTIDIIFRTRKGFVYKSSSYDGGYNWTIAALTNIVNTDTKTFIKILSNGDYLMAYNNNQTGRKFMTLAISKDEGETWEDKCMLYSRNCSYPNILEGDDGEIFVVFDDGRYKSCQWRTEGGVKTWGYCYLFRTSLDELEDMEYGEIAIDKLTTITKCIDIGGAGLEAVLEGKGTQAEPFKIQNASDWSIVCDYSEGNNLSGKYLKLTDDLTSIYKKIGTYALPFAGTLLGDGHSVYVERSYPSGDGNQGTLVGTLAPEGTVKDFVIEGTIDTLKTGDAAIGGAVGVNRGKVENVTNKANITTFGYGVGGVVGKNDGGYVTNCHNEGNITSSSTTTGNSKHGLGGIVGNHIGNACTISDCTNSGDIASAGTQIGGIVGASYATASGKLLIKNSSNSGKVTTTATVNGTSNEGVGGIIGFGLYTNIEKCTNDGEIRGKCCQVAGIAGKYADYGAMSDCVNNGNVFGLDQVGGMCGRFVGGVTAKNCTNTGVITYFSGDGHGQIAGFSNGSILDCVEQGSVVQGNI